MQTAAGFLFPVNYLAYSGGGFVRTIYSLEQLGGNKFVVMTGSHHFVSDGDTLRMQLRRNRSRANRLFITLDWGSDTYTMKFFYYRPGRIDLKTGRLIEDVEREIVQYTGVYAGDLLRFFEDVTGLATHL